MIPTFQYCKECDSIHEGVPIGVDCPDCQEELGPVPDDYKSDAVVYAEENPR